MKSSFNSILALSLLVVGGIIGATALSAMAETANWTAPDCTPPDCNAEAPLNVGEAAQAKSGLLALKSFLFNPAGSTGSVTVGSVLTAIDSDGTVGWADPGTPAYVLDKGVANINAGSYSAGSTNVTFSRTLPTIPVVTIQPQWTRLTGDESTVWWVTNVTTSGFTIHYHTPNSGTNYGEDKVMWIAMADSTALNVSSMSCTKSGSTYTFSGTPSGGNGTYSYRLYFTGKPYSIPLNYSITVPGTYTYTSTQSGFPTVFYRVTSGLNQADVSCPAS